MGHKASDANIRTVGGRRLRLSLVLDPRSCSISGRPACSWPSFALVMATLDTWPRPGSISLVDPVASSAGCGARCWRAPNVVARPRSSVLQHQWSSSLFVAVFRSGHGHPRSLATTWLYLLGRSCSIFGWVWCGVQCWRAPNVVARPRSSVLQHQWPSSLF